MEQKIYFYGMIILGLALIVAGVWSLMLNDNNLPKWEKLPRNLGVGILFGIVDLIWCIPHTRPLLPTSMHFLLIPAVVVCAFITFKFLDYVFARSLGGFFILLAYYLLHESFTYHTPLLPLYSFFCYLMGGAGLFFCGKPYLLRDLIRKMARDTFWRYFVGVTVLIFAGLNIVLGIMHLS